MWPWTERRADATSSERSWRGANGPDLFGRMVRVMKDHERLVIELESTNARLGRARVYLASPACHLALALTYFAHLQAKRSGLLDLLNANRIEAERILGACDPAGAPPWG